MERQMIKHGHHRPEMQWWPFRPKYLRLLHAYRAYTTGRCSPAALVRRRDGNFTATDILEAPDHPEDTWLVQPFWGKAGPERVRSRDIVDIECARVVAGYEC